MKKLECPNCSKEFSFLNFVSALTPWHLKCQNCQQKLKLDKFRIGIAIISLMAGIIFGGLSIFIYSNIRSVALVLVFLLLAILIFELSIYFLTIQLEVKLIRR